MTNAVKEIARPRHRWPSWAAMGQVPFQRAEYFSPHSCSTTRVLTEASISGKIDHLRGLKESVR
jgi:hypothetical protein